MSTTQAPKTYHRPSLTEAQLTLISSALTPLTATNLDALEAKLTIDAMLLRIQKRKHRAASGAATTGEGGITKSASAATPAIPKEAVTSELLLGLIQKEIQQESTSPTNSPLGTIELDDLE